MNKELILKAKEAKSAEELLALARENNIELTEEQAKEYYERLKGTGELSDDDLEIVAGGWTELRKPDYYVDGKPVFLPKKGCFS